MVTTHLHPSRQPDPRSHPRVGPHRIEKRNRRHRRWAAGALAPLVTVGGGTVLLPSASAAVGADRSLEADYGIEMVILGGYQPRTDVTVDVLRGGVVIGSVTTPTLADGSLEIHHGGGGQFPDGDCWGLPYTPDIQPGDTIRARQGAIEDTTVARDVFIDTENVRYDAAAGTITVSGHARGTGEAPIDLANDALSILIRFPVDVNPVPPEGPDQSLSRADRVGDEINDELGLDGRFTHTFSGYSRADIEAIADNPGTEVIVEWGGGGTELADPNELTVYSGDAGPLGGCPPHAPADQVPPSQVTGVVATQPALGTVELDWSEATDNVGVTGYVVTRTNLDTDEVTTYQVGNELFWSQTRVANGRYSYTVHAVDATGNAGAASAAVPVGVGVDAPPAAPTGLAAVVDGNSVTLTWTAPAGTVASYQVLRGATVVANAVTGTTSTDRNVPVGTHSYTVRSRAADGTLSPASEPATAQVVDTTSPSTVTLSGTVSGTTANLSWTAATDDVGVTGYQVFRNGEQVGGDLPVTPRTFADPALQPGTYSYTVRALDAAGNSTVSNTLSLTVASTNQAPTVTARTPRSNAFSVGVAANVTATFSEAVRGVGTGTFRVRNAAGTVIPATVSRNGTTNQWILNPHANLAADSRFTVTLTGGTAAIRDSQGAALVGTTAQPLSWSFTTGPAPRVSARTPGVNATGVARTANVTATFTEAVQAVSGTTVRLTNVLTGRAVTAVVSYNAATRVATLNPSATLAANTPFRVNLTGGTSAIRDRAGNPLRSLAWTFRTGG